MQLVEINGTTYEVPNGAAEQIQKTRELSGMDLKATEEGRIYCDISPDWKPTLYQDDDGTWAWK